MCFMSLVTTIAPLLIALMKIIFRRHLCLPAWSGWRSLGAMIAASLSWSSTAVAAPSQQAYLKASNAGVSDFFGQSVAASGETVVVGAHHEASNSAGVNGNQNNDSASGAGAAYVFVRQAGIWSQQAYLKASNTEANDQFGTSVAMSGDTIVAGAPGESSNATGMNGNQTDNSAPSSGAAYVFVRSGTNWVQQAYLKASNPGSFAHFGGSVSISGDTLVVGAPDEASNASGVNGNQSNTSASHAGAAYVFVRVGANWTQQAYLKASNTDGGDQLGGSVAVSGDTIVAGAGGEASKATGMNGDQSDNSLRYAGAAYVFVRSGTNWTQQAYIKASNTGANDFFGGAVSVSADTAIVGAPAESSKATGANGNESDDSVPNAGAVYVFARTGTNWTQEAYLKASNTGTNQFFGGAVSVSGEAAAIGAAGEASNATGVNGDASDQSAPNSGAAYVFVRNGTNWTQQAYLKASNAGASDFFGGAISISGETVVVGANGESSKTTGVNGGQSDNSAPGSGAAYLFASLGIGSRLFLVPDGRGGYFIRFNGTANVTYRLQRAPNLTGSWDTLAPLTAPITGGLLELHDTNSGQAFYRTVQP